MTLSVCAEELAFRGYPQFTLASRIGFWRAAALLSLLFGGLHYFVKPMEDLVFFFQAEDGIRYWTVTGVQTCALPISQAMNRQELGGDALAQRRQPLHGGVLVVPGGHGRGHELGEAWIDVVVGKALTEVERVELTRTPRHDREDRRAHLRQLARHAPPPSGFRRRQRGSDHARLAGKVRCPQLGR